MIYVFIVVPIILTIITVVGCNWYYSKVKTEKPKDNDNYIYALDMQKWRGGVRHRMGLEKTMEQFRQEANQIKYP